MKGQQNTLNLQGLALNVAILYVFLMYLACFSTV